MQQEQTMKRWAPHWGKRNMAKGNQEEGKKTRRTCGLVNSCSNAHRGELQ